VALEAEEIKSFEFLFNSNAESERGRYYIKAVLKGLEDKILDRVVRSFEIEPFEDDGSQRNPRGATSGTHGRGRGIAKIKISKLKPHEGMPMLESFYEEDKNTVRINKIHSAYRLAELEKSTTALWMHWAKCAISELIKLKINKSLDIMQQDITPEEVEGMLRQLDTRRQEFSDELAKISLIQREQKSKVDLSFWRE